MSERKDAKGSPGRRTFLVGLLTGAGVVAALGAAVPRKASGGKTAAGATSSAAEPILYRRTEEAERYYRTLYYA